MDCPVCDSNMEEGEVFLKKRWLNQLVFGWGSTDLVFKHQRSRKETELMNPWEFSKAYHCRKCGAALIATASGESEH